MAKIKDSFYFDSFDKSSQYALQASTMLDELMHDFKPDGLKEQIDRMHEIEQAADGVRHSLVDALVTAFITPIDREDIAALSGSLDDVTDEIEGVLHRMYYDNITEIRPEALALVDLLRKSCKTMAKLVAQMHHFKKAKKLRNLVFEINHIEQEADALFVDAMRTLHTTCDDPMQVFAWHEVFTQLEECIDACEEVADVIDNIVMKNS
ncbi:DUF47 domain-containing protein [Bifidobacterium oedipodis]|uniref:Phosphate transport regulator n=1 Tax=Bifidobacterium oedipodis TaxID=2675322 RepID=A0A7Y0ENU4_9BIFI|nr:DUF47 family protein [Bifidobacterium sp. DSM 109957]NMM93728.1 Phosphate transport regulator [Bifidobacterium sp. DSM 109957]